MPCVSSSVLVPTHSRRAWPSRTLAATILALAIGMTGCAVTPPSPAASPAPKEPYLLLKLNERRVYVMDDPTAPPAGYPVAIGRPQWPTPTGKFQINQMVENPDFVVFDFNNPEGSKDRGRIAPGIGNPLGLRWIGFAYDHGWAIGFHGTQKTEVLGQAVSHGCVRMSNPDVVEMFARVKLGTPVVVEP
jgi:L,D-transpeptidase ErfK/SrfK